MAFTVAPNAAANSFASVAAAEAYFAERPAGVKAGWTGAADDTAKEQALVLATSILEARCWKGTKTHTLAENARSWPRDDVYDPNGDELDKDTVPAFLVAATAELANAYLAGDIDASGNSTAGSSTQATKSIAIEDAIKIEYNNGQAVSKAFRAPHASVVDALIKPYLAEAGAMMGLERA